MTSPAVSTVEPFVLEGFRQLVAEPDAVAPDTELAALQIDSLDMVELGQMIEDEYGATLERKQFEAVKTVADVVQVIQKLVADNA